MTSYVFTQTTHVVATIHGFACVVCVKSTTKINDNHSSSKIHKSVCPRDGWAVGTVNCNYMESKLRYSTFVKNSPPPSATMSKQRCWVLQVERFFRQSPMLLRHCCLFWQQYRTTFRLFDKVDFVERTNCRSTSLPKPATLFQKRQQCRSNIRLRRKDEILR